MLRAAGSLILHTPFETRFVSQEFKVSFKNASIIYWVIFVHFYFSKLYKAI